ncbi:uncharacterized protein BDR25DRAFT_352730 [Lindgomyces ingoldianus]|uniref:Uncharacterized protein n=1 Tax=Lindgomyces ingoldianus TaxID=673940 RepID=A0ACB6R232_9PLEO|nr:uncharacterized protein BDR25DRAFT_352730 [Lindgomyces ingoldianus]KAF2473309.1 hypothetical protein BDR25DRAFT_352730 [Lindgomyces ingoldianus]
MSTLGGNGDGIMPRDGKIGTGERKTRINTGAGRVLCDACVWIHAKKDVREMVWVWDVYGACCLALLKVLKFRRFLPQAIHILALISIQPRLFVAIETIEGESAQTWSVHATLLSTSPTQSCSSSNSERYMGTKCPHTVSISVLRPVSKQLELWLSTHELALSHPPLVVPDFIPEQHEEGLELGPNQIAEERGALGRDPSRRAELHGEESFVERFSKEREASWRVSSRRENVNAGNISLTRQQEFLDPVEGQPGSVYEQWCETDVAIASDVSINSTYAVYWVWQWPTAPGTLGALEGKDET